MVKLANGIVIDKALVTEIKIKNKKPGPKSRTPERIKM
jgi:hypothetical protein